MGADQVGVVDVGVIDVLPGLHLSLQLLNDVALLNQIVGDLEPGDLSEGLGEHLGLIGMGGERLGHHADLQVPVGRGGLREPSHLRQLLLTAQGGGLEFSIHPAGGVGRVVHGLISRRLVATASAERKQGRNGGPWLHVGFLVLASCEVWWASIERMRWRWPLVASIALAAERNLTLGRESWSGCLC